MTRLVFVALSLCLLFAGGAIAQDNWSVIPNDYVMNDLLNRQRIEAVIGRPVGTPAKPQASSQTSPQAKVAPPAGSTVYTTSPEVSRRVQAAFVAEMRGRVGPENAAEIEAVLTRGDAVASWASVVGGDGLKPGDMADAFAAYWVLNWVMANGADSTRAQALAVRDQVRPVMAGYGGLGNARKQEMAETFMLNFLLQQAAYTDAMRRGDQTAMKQLGEAAQARFRREMGVDLRTLKLTDGGFKPA